MSISALVWAAITGIVAGWFASLLFKGKGLGLFGNLVLGLVGGLIGGYLFKFMGISFGGWVGSVFTAFAGAAALLVVVGLLRKI